MGEFRDDSLKSKHRPAPIFNLDSHSLSTKKERRTPRFMPPPKLPIKSCPVTRIFSNIETIATIPVPVSFRIDDDTTFISQSPIYSSHQGESYFEQCYKVEDKLGVGSFGEVYRVRSREDGQIYACKKSIRKFRGDTDRRRKMAEVAKHQKLPKHSNCVQFYRAWEEGQRLYILTEACQQSLAALADSSADAVPETGIWGYALDLLQAIQHLHQHSLVHMDIKPENIFLSSDGVCKLGDFGLMFDISKDNLSEAIEGDPAYMAPECMASQFGPAADLFSLGISLLELALNLELPKHGEMWHSLRQGQLPDAAKSLSPSLQTLLAGLLDPSPQSRLTASQALKLPRLLSLSRRRAASLLLQRGVRTLSSMVLWWLLPLAVLLQSGISKLRDYKPFCRLLGYTVSNSAENSSLQQYGGSPLMPCSTTPHHIQHRTACTPSTGRPRPQFHTTTSSQSDDSPTLYTNSTQSTHSSHCPTPSTSSDHRPTPYSIDSNVSQATLTPEGSGANLDRVSDAIVPTVDARHTPQCCSRGPLSAATGAYTASVPPTPQSSHLVPESRDASAPPVYPRRLFGDSSSSSDGGGREEGDVIRITKHTSQNLLSLFESAEYSDSE